MPVIKRILCPVDFSDTAAIGAREAAGLARAADAELLLVHTLSEPWLSTHEEHGYPSPVVQQYEMIVRQKLERAAQALSSVANVRCALLRGPVDEAIAQAASKHGADLIVMGTRSRKGLARLLMDSTTEKVMRKARVPVVRVCPAPNKPPPYHVMERHGTA